MLPLIGRIADLRGRVPVLVAALVVFAFGSLVTAAGLRPADLVAGRFLQGVGGGGLVPATLALVADLYPVERRGVPLGVVSAVQELGSVLGPLYGAVILAVSDWRVIFAVNLVVGLVLAAAHPLGSPGGDPRGARATAARLRLGRRLLLLAVVLVAGALVFVEPSRLVQRRHLGPAVRPGRGLDARWLTPLGLVDDRRPRCCCVVRCWTARRPLVDLRGWWRAAPRGRPGRRPAPGRRPRRA